MKNEENGKKIWETPEVFDLDVKDTQTGAWTGYVEDAHYNPS
jgi:hypothetical protein